MTVAEPTLFDVAPEPFRNSDPLTARAAAQELDSAKQRSLVLDGLHALGGNGTADEVRDWLNRNRPQAGEGWQRNVVSSRLSQLKDGRRYGGNPPVRDSGSRRPSAAGKAVIVFEVVRAAS